MPRLTYEEAIASPRSQRISYQEAVGAPPMLLEGYRGSGGEDIGAEYQSAQPSREELAEANRARGVEGLSPELQGRITKNQSGWYNPYGEGSEPSPVLSTVLSAVSPIADIVAGPAARLAGYETPPISGVLPPPRSKGEAVARGLAELGGIGATFLIPSGPLLAAKGGAAAAKALANAAKLSPFLRSLAGYTGAVSGFTAPIAASEVVSGEKTIPRAAGDVLRAPLELPIDVAVALKATPDNIAALVHDGASVDKIEKTFREFGPAMALLLARDLLKKPRTIRRPKSVEPAEESGPIPLTPEEAAARGVEAPKVERFTRDRLLTVDGVRAFIKAMPEKAVDVAAKERPSRSDVGGIIRGGDKLTESDRVEFSRLLNQEMKAMSEPLPPAEAKVPQRQEPLSEEVQVEKEAQGQERPQENVLGGPTVTAAGPEPAAPSPDRLTRETTNAVQERSATEVLQREPEAIAAPRGQRGRVERIVEELETSREGEPQAPVAQAPTEAIPGMASPVTNKWTGKAGSWRQWLETAAAEAEARAEKRIKEGQLFSNPLDPALIKDYAIIGAKHIADGALTVAEFSKRMVEQFGEKIRPYLQELWVASRDRLHAISRPDLARPVFGETAQAMMDATDFQRNQAGKPETSPRAEAIAAAEQRLSVNGLEAETQLLLKGAADPAYLPTQVDVEVAKRVMQKAAENLTTKFSAEAAKSANKIVDAYREGGKKTAQSLQQRAALSPEESRSQAISEAILRPSAKAQAKIDAAEDAGNTALADKIRAQDAVESARIKQKIEKVFGDPLTDLSETARNPRRSAQIVREISAMKGLTSNTPAFEWWMNSILSGPLTFIRNLSSIPNALYKMFPQRAVEAAINLAVRDPGSATFAEFPALVRGIMPGLSNGWRNAVEAWYTEQPQLERKHGLGARELMEGGGSAIAGMKGRIIRTPTASLRMADEFIKSLTAHMEVGAMAIRQSNIRGRVTYPGGMKGDALAEFIRREIADPNSESWRMAIERSQEYAFQEKGGRVAQAVKGVGYAMRDLPSGEYVATFVNTPVNIFRQGFKITPPVAAFDVGKAVADYLRTGNKSKLPESTARLVIAAGVSTALWELVASGLITGGDDRDRPYSAKIGDEWYSYAGIEPFATAIGLMVDGITAVRTGSPGKSIKALAFDSFVNQVSNKTFLKQAGDLFEAIREAKQGEEIKPGAAINRWAVSFLQSWVPNIIRQPLRQASKTRSERRDWGEGTEGWERLLRRLAQGTELPQVFGYLDNIAKVDVWGREIMSSAGTGTGAALARMFIPVGTRADDKLMGAQIVSQFNRDHPTDPYWPQIPAPSYQVDGEKKWMTDQQYHDYLVLAGQVAQRLVEQYDWTGLKDEDLRAQLQDVFADSRKVAREALVKEWSGGTKASLDGEAVASALYERNVSTVLERFNAERPKYDTGRGASVYRERLARWQKERSEAAEWLRERNITPSKARSIYWRSIRDESSTTRSRSIARLSGRLRELSETGVSSRP